MVEILQIKVAKEWKLLEELLDTPVLGVIKQFKRFLLFFSLYMHIISLTIRIPLTVFTRLCYSPTGDNPVFTICSAIQN